MTETNTREAARLPSALASEREIAERLLEGRPAIFFDYDGTLTPIVEDPDQALLAETTRQLLRRLSKSWLVVIMSGRGLEDVRKHVGIDGLVYAGSHGFNIVGPHDSFHEEPWKELRSDLDEVEGDVRRRLQDLDGVRVERKPYSIAMHYRQATAEVGSLLKERLDGLASNYTNLRLTDGKKVFEFRPRVDWDKGKALLYLLDRLYLDSSRALPIYFGDDTTDEDAFRAIVDRGIGVLVTENNQSTYASYVLRDPDEVAVFIEELVKLAELEPTTSAWSLVYEGFNPDSEKLREALCTLGNGYFATRGAAPESAACAIHYPGTYLAGVYNRLSSDVSGMTIENESLVNVPNWLPLSFSIEGEWFSLSSVEILWYRQELDMKRGVLLRNIEFRDSGGRRTKLMQRRFVHMTYPHLGGLETTITPVNWSGSLRVRSALDGSVQNTLVERYRQLNNHHLAPLDTGVSDDGFIWLEVETNQSHVRITEVARTDLFVGEERLHVIPTILEEDSYIAQDYELTMEKGKCVRVEKIVALYKSGDPAMSNGLVEALDSLRHAADFDCLLARQCLAWRHLWERWKIVVDAGNPKVEQALDLHIFHLLQTVSPNIVDKDVGVPPRGLHGEAYRGLIMWDELFIFPLVNLRMPDITRELLMYRFRRLPRACWAAEYAGYRGAMFPWQSGSDGREQAQTLHLNPKSGRWLPDNSQLERHINIAVAYNVWQYYQVTNDKEFMSFYGAPLMVQIARFWASKVEYDENLDRYRIPRVMGPDEFHDSYPDSSEPGIDDNAYTNAMAAWVFWRTLDVLDMLSRERRTFIMQDVALNSEEVQSWNDMSRKLYVPFHDGIISQFHGYDDLEEFDWDGYHEKYGNIHRLDRILEAEGDSPNRYKVSKQADVLMLFYLLSTDELCQLFGRLGYPFTPDSIADTVNYYLKRTSHGSTLSRVVHAWVLARLEHDMSWSLFQDALESDIEDSQGGTTHEGIHLGAMAGTVDLLLRCYSGMESRDDVLWFNPSLPPKLKSLRFGISYRRSRIDVHLTGTRLRLRRQPAADSPVGIGVKGEVYQLAPGEEIRLDL